ncbi:hypothetical protein Tco_1313150 [Tanacetum coccineum]
MTVVRLISIESSQVALRSKISSFKQDTSEIKSMMTEIFKAFKGMSFSTPSSSVPTTTLAITKGPTTVEGENFTHAATKEPPSHTEGENDDMKTQETKVKKEPEKETTKEVPTRPTRVVPISTVRPITRHNPKVALIESSSRPPLTNIILEILIPQLTGLVIDITPPEPQVTQKEGKGIAIGDESPKKTMPASTVVRQDPDEPI